MNELLSISYEEAEPTVGGRELHAALEVITRYNDWFARMCEYGFSEGKDYYSFLSNRSDGLPGKPATNHRLTIPMAKEICMLQRTDKGKQARLYLLEVERQWNTPQAVMSRALKMADETIDGLKGQVMLLQAVNSELTVTKQIMAPKADYFDQLVDRNLLTSFRETAKQLKVKERAFVAFLMEHKYIYRDKKGRLMPYSGKHDDLFEVKECVNEKTDWKGTQTLVTPKGRETFRLLTEGLAQ